MTHEGSIVQNLTLKFAYLAGRVQVPVEGAEKPTSGNSEGAGWLATRGQPVGVVGRSDLRRGCPALDSHHASPSIAVRVANDGHEYEPPPVLAPGGPSARGCPRGRTGTAGIRYRTVYTRTPGTARRQTYGAARGPCAVRPSGAGWGINACFIRRLAARPPSSGGRSCIASHANVLFLGVGTT